MAAALRRLLVTTAVAWIAAPTFFAEEPVRLADFFVPGQRIARIEIPVPRGDLRPPEPNLGQELLAIPGVYSQMRATDAMEPNLRGLGFDRVATTIDGLPLVNASPERTNSPVVILGSAAVTGMTVVKGLPSVTLGPGVTGGRIALTTDLGIGTAPGNAAQVNATYDGARQGWMTNGRVTAATSGFDVTATAFRDDLFDYRSSDGRRVAARFDDHGESATAGWLTGTQRAHVAVIHRRLRHVDTLSLPLDGKNTDAAVLTLNYRWSSPLAATLRQIDLRAGYSTTDPFITSEDRLSPSISAEAVARTTGAGVTIHLVPTEAATLRVGADTATQRRRAVRSTPAGKDYIWPGVHYADNGAFAELEQTLASEWTLRLGGRIDDVRSDADDADLPALGKPIRVQYATYNGADAAVTRRSSTAGAANAIVEARLSPMVTMFAGVGYSVQPPQVMERYRAFLNALGGDGHGGNAVELGNPALLSEAKAAVEAGATVRSAVVDAEATVYAYHISHYILRTPIGTTEAPLAKMPVFGYRNAEAELHGAELGTTWKPAPGWNAPVTLSIAEGRNEQTGYGLAEIPPWELAAAIRHEHLWFDRRVALEVGTRIVGHKTNPAPQESPLFSHTSGFAVWHVRAGTAITRNLRFEAGLENMFNRAYTEYLNPPVAPVRPASGDLLPGQQIPAPGRSWWMSVTKKW